MTSTSTFDRSSYTLSASGSGTEQQASIRGRSRRRKITKTFLVSSLAANSPICHSRQSKGLQIVTVAVDPAAPDPGSITFEEIPSVKGNKGSLLLLFDLRTVAVIAPVDQRARWRFGSGKPRRVGSEKLGL